jgi:hypothetical protein
VQTRPSIHELSVSHGEAPHDRIPTQTHLLIPLGVAILTAFGCGDSLVPHDEPPSLAASVLPADPEMVFFETGTNDHFETADFVQLADREQLIRGRLSASNDVDVYELGPAEVGDRVVVEFLPDEGLRGMIALFDADHACLLVNDDRNTYLGRKEPFIDVVIREASPACYVAVGANPTELVEAGYSLRASRRAGAVVPPARPDVVLLDFGGGAEVVIGNRPAIRIPRFDAADISETYAGATGEMIRLVVERVRADFAAFDLTVRSTHESPPVDPTATRVYFGAYDEGLLGVADGIDEFNATRRQEAIIFTDSFAAMTRLNPSVEEMAQALANIASHEIGHLLGLVHTRDPAGLMDVSASLAQLMSDQRFRDSGLAGDVFPIGTQDAAKRLVQSVGGDIELARAPDEPDSVPAKPIAPAPTHPEDPHGPLSTCALGEYQR